MNLVNFYNSDVPVIPASDTPYNIYYGNNAINYGIQNDLVKSNADLTNNYKLNEEKSGTGCVGYFEGELNGQPSSYKRTGREDNNSFVVYSEGNVGNKKFLIEKYGGKKDNKIDHYRGTYNGKEFQLDLKVNNSDSTSKVKRFFDGIFHKYNISSVNISGTFNNKDFNLTAPNTSVPLDDDIRDVVSFISRESSVSLGTINGNIVSAQYDWDVLEFIQKRNDEKSKKIKSIPKEIGAIITAGAASLSLFLQLASNEHVKNFLSKFRHP